MSMSKTAVCCCGQVQVHCNGDPIRVSMCHCYACQQRTGSVQARFNTDQVSVEGDTKEYVRIGDSGGRIAFHFCGHCGSTMYYKFDGMPAFTIVPVGNFQDSNFLAPKISVYENRKHDWVSVPEDVEHCAIEQLHLPATY